MKKLDIRFVAIGMLIGVLSILLYIAAVNNEIILLLFAGIVFGVYLFYRNVKS